MERLPDWAPIKKVHLLSSQKEGVGAVCSCEFEDKRLGTIQEEIIEWEPQRKITRKITGGPVKSMTESSILTPTADGTTLTMRGDFELGGFKKLFAGMAAKQFEKNMDDALTKLKDLLERYPDPKLSEPNIIVNTVTDSPS